MMLKNSGTLSCVRNNFIITDFPIIFEGTISQENTIEGKTSEFLKAFKYSTQL